MVRAELRETRSPVETNWYFAIEVWACAWAIGNMHWASTKLKLTFCLKKRVLRLPGGKITHFCILILEYDESNAPFKSNVQG